MKLLLSKMLLCIVTTLFLLFLFYPFSSSFAQTGKTKINGVVNDSRGNPLPNVTIGIRGSQQKTMTKTDGSFEIEAPEGSILEVSHVGYLEQSLKTKRGEVLEIRMTEKDAGVLSDVVVVGYGSVKKSDLTGSVGVVDVADAKKTASYDVAKILQGQVAGVTVQGSGEPGGFQQIKIRGISTFGNNSPLFVVDGVPVDGPFDFSTNDIESIQVLKDASAGAIYGSRASTGVVIITTKKGKAGPMKVTYNAYYGYQNIAKKIPLTDRLQYQTITSAAEVNAGLQVAPGNDPSSPQFISNINTDWQKEDFKTGNIQNHDVNLSGGNETIHYNVALGYFDQSSTLAGPQNYKRYTIDNNLQGNKGIFSFGAKFAYSLSNKINNTYPHLHPNVGNGVTNLLIDIPTMPVYDSTREGGYGGTDNVIQKAICINPIGMNNLITDHSDRARMLANVWGQVEFVKNLKYRINLSYDRLDYKNLFFEPTYDLGWYYTNNIAYMSETNGINTTALVENTLTYSLSFGKSKVDALAGTTYQKDNYSNTVGTGQGFTQPYFYTLSAASNTYPKSIAERLDIATLVSYLGRINYNYDNRYFITGNFRRDGSSKFISSNRFSNFGSVAGLWNVSNEKFITLPKVISSLKFRGGYGTLGNQNIGNYLYQSVVNSNASYLFGNTPTLAPGTTSTFVVDPTIKWETKTTSNVAVEIGLLDNRLLLTGEYFTNKVKDLLVAIPIPLSVGSTGGPSPNSVVTNAASMENKGLEFTVAYKKTTGLFNYNVSGNISTLKNQVLGLGGINNPIYGIGSKTALGQSVGQLYGFKTEGLFQDASDVAKHATQTGAAPGDVKFVDTNKDGQITDDDRIYLGSAIPKITYGFNFDASYRNFDFSFFFQGSAGNKVFNGIYQTLMAGQYTNHSVDEINYWTPTNTNTNVPRPVIYDPNANDRFSDRFVESGSYMKLQNAQIGYTFPANILGHTKVITSFRIYASGQNLLTITKYKGYDPDFISDGLFSRGYDYGSFPNPRSVIFGIQLGL